MNVLDPTVKAKYLKYISETKELEDGNIVVRGYHFKCLHKLDHTLILGFPREDYQIVKYALALDYASVGLCEAFFSYTYTIPSEPVPEYEPEPKVKEPFPDHATLEEKLKILSEQRASYIYQDNVFRGDGGSEVKLDLDLDIVVTPYSNQHGYIDYQGNPLELIKLFSNVQQVGKRLIYTRPFTRHEHNLYNIAFKYRY